MARYVPKAGQHVSAKLRQRILERDQATCQYCGISLYAQYMLIEHIIPAAWDGPAQPYNLVVACGSCNVHKGRGVWIPRNLDSITVDHLDWRAKVIALSQQNKPKVYAEPRSMMGILVTHRDQATIRQYAETHGITITQLFHDALRQYGVFS